MLPVMVVELRSVRHLNGLDWNKGGCVRTRAGRIVFVLALVVGLVPCAPVAGQDAGEAFRTPWGDPDLQGVWDYWTFTPLERPEEFLDRDQLTAEEAAVVAQEGNVDALARDEAAPPGEV